MEKEIKIYNLDFDQLKTYLFVTLFVAGNIIFPQLCHLIPNGGHIFLPIYFFTLIASYKYGMKVGVMTAVLSPAVNSILFGMPAAAVVPSIMIKSVFLAIAASWVAEKSNKVSLWSVLLVILSYQLFGSLVEWIMTGSLYAAAVDFRLGVPGMLIQWLGGFLFIKYMK
ncbi:MAG: ECF transporter S component [Candidatus Limimorpha sp.]|nr:ECF transporter S component [Bacteroidales bacterium]MDD7277122.1 ECF transporter S component [Bacteroidales bacterium]MDY6074943.1 ECF transporter S component [Bacteroidales bacterium]